MSHPTSKNQSIGGEPGEQSDFPQQTAGRKSARQIDVGALPSGQRNDFETNVAILRQIVEFAYEQGFHELGYNVVDEWLEQVRPVHETACEHQVLVLVDKGHRCAKCGQFNAWSSSENPPAELGASRLEYVEHRLVRAEAAILNLGAKALETSYMQHFPEPWIPGDPIPAVKTTKALSDGEPV